MLKNMGWLDRLFRVLIAAGIAYLWYEEMISGPVAIGLMVLALIFVVTSVIGFCPLYRLFGFSTGGARK